MLIITRRIQEGIVIGGSIHVAILGIKGNQVRLGVDAPLSISVHRQEIHSRLMQEQEYREYCIHMEERFAESIDEKLIRAFKNQSNNLITH